MTKDENTREAHNNQGKMPYKKTPPIYPYRPLNLGDNDDCNTPLIHSVNCNWINCVHRHDCIVVRRSTRDTNGRKIAKFLPELSLHLDGAYFVKCKDYVDRRRNSDKGSKNE